MSSPSINRVAATLAAVFLLAGCAGSVAPDSEWPGSALARYEAAVVDVDAGNVTEAEDVFEALAEAYPASTGPHRQLARLALQRGEAEVAVVHLEAARLVCEDCAAVLTELGLAERVLGAFENAREAYEAALAENPDFAPAHFDLAVLHELYLSRPGDAIRHYQRYLELAGETPEQRRIEAWIARLEREADAKEAARLAAGDVPRTLAGTEP